MRNVGYIPPDRRVFTQSGALFGAVSRIRRLGHCCVWDWNGIELIVTQPFDPGEDVSYSIEEAFVPRENHTPCDCANAK
jgi:hypothetical protein